jgi:hypothetical protein
MRWVRTQVRTHGTDEAHRQADSAFGFALFYTEFDWRKRKRLIIKVLGE